MRVFVEGCSLTHGGREMMSKENKEACLVTLAAFIVPVLLIPIVNFVFWVVSKME